MRMALLQAPEAVGVGVDTWTLATTTQLIHAYAQFDLQIEGRTPARYLVRSGCR